MEMHTYTFCLNVVRGSPMEFARMSQWQLEGRRGRRIYVIKSRKLGVGARRRELKNGSYINKIRTLGTKNSNK